MGAVCVLTKEVPPICIVKIQCGGMKLTPLDCVNHGGFHPG